MKVECMKLWRKPLDADDFEPPRGKVYIIDDRCKGCRFCIEFCPMDVLEESEKFNSKGYHPPEVTNPDACVNCQLCELICPEFSIYVLDAKEAENKDNKKSSKGGGKKKSGKTESKKNKGKGAGS
jgi:2-oxoglutarate ferredoxin oxidoreductase subunit delta